jgi:hypothetical protein
MSSGCRAQFPDSVEFTGNSPSNRVPLKELE